MTIVRLLSDISTISGLRPLSLITSGYSFIPGKSAAIFQSFARSRILSPGNVGGILFPAGPAPDRNHRCVGACFFAFSLALFLVTSTASASFLSTWLCLHVCLPLPNASLQDASTLFSVCTPPHSAHLSSSDTFHLAKCP